MVTAAVRLIGVALFVTSLDALVLQTAQAMVSVTVDFIRASVIQAGQVQIVILQTARVNLTAMAGELVLKWKTELLVSTVQGKVLVAYMLTSNSNRYYWHTSLPVIVIGIIGIHAYQ